MPTFPPPDHLKSAHITPADGNVFEDLGFSPDEAATLLANADESIKSAVTEWQAENRQAVESSNQIAEDQGLPLGAARQAEATLFLEAREDYQLQAAPEVLRWAEEVGRVLRDDYRTASASPRIWAYRFDGYEFLNCAWTNAGYGGAGHSPFVLGFALQSTSPRLLTLDELFGKHRKFNCGDVPVTDMTDALMLLQLIEQARTKRPVVSFGMDVHAYPTKPESQ